MPREVCRQWISRVELRPTRIPDRAPGFPAKETPCGTGAIARPEFGKCRADASGFSLPCKTQVTFWIGRILWPPDEDIAPHRVRGWICEQIPTWPAAPSGTSPAKPPFSPESSWLGNAQSGEDAEVQVPCPFIFADPTAGARAKFAGKQTGFRFRKVRVAR